MAKEAVVLGDEDVAFAMILAEDVVSEGMPGFRECDGFEWGRAS